MDLYLHVDRGGGIRPGMTIRLEPYRREESELMLLEPCMDIEFLTHIEKMLDTGISLHGARYLRMLGHNADFISMTTELVYEAYRMKHCPDKPSRLQSLFAFGSLAEAVAFAGEGKHVYAVHSDEVAYKYDMNALKLSYDQREQDEYAARYWRGAPLSSDAGYKPMWEYLLTLPVEVLREVV